MFVGFFFSWLGTFWLGFGLFFFLFQLLHSSYCFQHQDNWSLIWLVFQLFHDLCLLHKQFIVHFLILPCRHNIFSLKHLCLSAYLLFQSSFPLCMLSHRNRCTMPWLIHQALFVSSASSAGSTPEGCPLWELGWPLLLLAWPMPHQLLLCKLLAHGGWVLEIPCFSPGSGKPPLYTVILCFALECTCSGAGHLSKWHMCIYQQLKINTCIS